MIGDEEPLIRVIFSPVFLKNGELRRSAFTPRSGTNQISVTRLHHSTPHMCKRQRNYIHIHDDYTGLASIYAVKVRECNGSDAVAAPTKQNSAHAHIELAEKKIYGEPMSPRMLEAADMLCERARFFPDPDINSDEWTGDDLEYSI